MQNWNSLPSHICLESGVNDLKRKLCNSKFLEHFFLSFIVQSLFLQLFISIDLSVCYHVHTFISYMLIF